MKQSSKRSIRTLSPALAAAGLAILGIWATYQEALPFFTGAGNEIDRVLALGAGRGGIGLSTVTQRSALLDCGTVLSSYFSSPVKDLPVQARQTIAPTCSAIAGQVVATSPTDAYALFVGAYAAAILKDWPAFNDQLGRSYLVGPQEQWIAEWRFALAEIYLHRLLPSVQRGHESDLNLLVRSDHGISAIAGRYIANTEFRTRITAIVDAMSNTDKTRFLSTLRRLIG